MNETRAAIVATLADEVMVALRGAAERAEDHGPMAADAMARAVELAEAARGGDVEAFGRLLDLLASVAAETLEGECLQATLDKLAYLRIEAAAGAGPEDLDALGVDVVTVDFEAGTTPEQDAALRAWAQGGDRA